MPRPPRFRWPERCVMLLVAALIAGALGTPGSGRTAFGQAAIPAAVHRHGPVSAEEREELYRQLHSQAGVLEQQAAVIRTVAKLVGPTVVHIEAHRAPAASGTLPRRGFEEEIGSGVLIQEKGRYFVITNRHVIRGAGPKTITINLADGRQINPDKVWQDEETDVAVMAVSAPNLVAAPVGDSDRIEIGDFVLAVGSPFGLKHTVTYGIISAKGRRDLGLDSSGVKLQDFLQTDAAINPGSSGGPLVNLQGELIGINTAIASRSGVDEGVAFAIPVNMFMAYARQLIERGVVTYGFLGVNWDEAFDPAMATELGLPYPAGARIKEVVRNSPAAAAKLQVGDVILRFNEVPVENGSHLRTIVSLTEIGKEVPLVVFRKRESLLLKVAVGDKSDFSQ